jgi:lysophospholipid acyltransferase (LPLAT)-like uncharacterized protein
VANQTSQAPVAGRDRRKSFWRSVRQPLKDSKLVKWLIVSLAANYVRLVRLTNPLAKGSDDPETGYVSNRNSIFTIWHGQHLFVVAWHPRHDPMAAMISRSADAEINALYVERFGVKVFRGSGGRDRDKSVEKGGARALIALKKALDSGMSVTTVADIPHGTPRDAGMGVITLAKLSGRPIVPMAVATSRGKVLEKSWDKTTISLPFGRSAICFGEPIAIARDADDAQLEGSRRYLTAALNAVTARAEGLVRRPA